MTIDSGSIRTLHALKLTTWVALFVGSILFGCACSGWIPSYTAAVIPIAIALIMFPIVVNLAVNRLDMNVKKISKQIILSFAYNLSLSWLIFAFLGCLLLDEAIDIPWAFVFAPAWYGFVIIFLFAIYLAPGMIQKKYYRALFLIFAYWAALLAFSIMWICNIEYDSPPNFLYSWIPVAAVLVLHIITYMRERIQYKKAHPNEGLHTSEFFYAILSLLQLTGMMTVQREVLTFIPSLVLAAPLVKAMVVWLYLEEKSYWGWGKPENKGKEYN